MRILSFCAPLRGVDAIFAYSHGKSAYYGGCGGLYLIGGFVCCLGGLSVINLGVFLLQGVVY